MKLLKSFAIVSAALVIIALNAVLLTSAVFSIPVKDLLWQLAESFELRTGTGALSKGPVIVCWGDSLTAGLGVGFGKDYPSQLSVLMKRPILNEGIPGNTSTQIRERMVHRLPGFDRGVTVIWAGRNNFAEPEAVLKDVDAMVASLPRGANYLVLGIINGDFAGEEKGGEKYEQISSLNADLGRVYGNRFIPIREILAAQGQQDDRDIIPASLRADPLHLGAPGYKVVAELVQRKITSLGW